MPADTRVIMPLLEVIIATPEASLEYVIAPLLSLVGIVVALNGAAPNVFDPATENDDRDVVPRKTVSTDVILVGTLYCAL